MSAGLQTSVSLGSLSNVHRAANAFAGGHAAGSAGSLTKGETLAKGAGLYKDSQGAAPPSGFGFDAEGDGPAEPASPSAESEAPKQNTTNIGWTTLVWANQWPDESIYGVAIAINLLHNSRPPKAIRNDVHYTWHGILFEDFVIYGPYWLMLFAALLGQIAIIVYTRRIVLDRNEDVGIDCKNTSYFLQLIGLMVFSVMIWVDLWESFKMIIYIRWLPLLKPGKEWDLGLTEVVCDDNGEVVDFARDGGETHGIYQRTRYLLYFFVIVPKICIAMALWWYGCSFLLVSEDDADLLLNSVALLFVLDIDEFVCRLVPESTRLQVSKFPTYELHAEEFFKAFIPSPTNPSLSVLGKKLRNKEEWCAKSNLLDPVFFWSTYGHWIPPFVIFTGVFCAQEIICSGENDRG